MGLLREFRQFVLKGSVADIGIGLVLGAAFTGLIDSLLTDVLLPPVGILLAKMNFSNLFITLGDGTYQSLAEAQEAGVATVNYGLFITAVIRFLIVVFVMFLVIRQINRWKKPNQDPSITMSKKECPYCRMAIPSLATKCPQCSSKLEEKSGENNTKNRRSKQMRITIS